VRSTKTTGGKDSKKDLQTTKSMEVNATSRVNSCLINSDYQLITYVISAV